MSQQPKTNTDICRAPYTFLFFPLDLTPFFPFLLFLLLFFRILLTGNDALKMEIVLVKSPSSWSLICRYLPYRENLQEEYNNMSISVLWKWVLDPGYLPVICIYLYRISYRLLLRAVCLVLENELREPFQGLSVAIFQF